MPRRASSGYTFANCHGCRKPPNSYGGRLKEGVCRDCEDLLKFAKKMQLRQTSLSETEPYIMPQRFHDLPYLPHCRSFDGPNDTIQTAFHTLLRLVSEPTEWDSTAEPVIVPSKHTSYGETVRMSPLVRNEINTLYNTFILALNEAYAEGKRDGERFITALAKGEVSIDRFNEAVTKQS